ncbi:hypothetical protein BXP70_08920 [Hymenobacter crusticola]|uniref:Uncharacterized protein n=1 Tax=Hymenobacter crusticola TaxID=1770526 RepID=A0A243WGI3_9BACT|nr:hypothetical protein BXP70_08920 [Hymenobacter crusticola]
MLADGFGLPAGPDLAGFSFFAAWLSREAPASRIAALFLPSLPTYRRCPFHLGCRLLAQRRTKLTLDYRLPTVRATSSFSALLAHV